MADQIPLPSPSNLVPPGGLRSASSASLPPTVVLPKIPAPRPPDSSKIAADSPKKETVRITLPPRPIPGVMAQPIKVAPPSPSSVPNEPKKETARVPAAIPLGTKSFGAAPAAVKPAIASATAPAKPIAPSSGFKSVPAATIAPAAAKTTMPKMANANSLQESNESSDKLTLVLAGVAALGSIASAALLFTGL